jgi:hypothetical protein
VLEVFAPGSRKRVLQRRIARRAWLAPKAGEVVRAERQRLRVTRVHARIDRDGDRIEHVTEIYTSAIARPRKRRVELPANVVRMPTGDSSVVADLLRYHVLIRVFGGDPDAWLAHLRDGDGDDGDLRFVRRLRSRLRQDPSLLIAIRRMVDATPFWRVAEA